MWEEVGEGVRLWCWMAGGVTNLRTEATLSTATANFTEIIHLRPKRAVLCV